MLENHARLFSYLSVHHPLHKTHSVWPLWPVVLAQPATELLLDDPVWPFDRSLKEKKTGSMSDVCLCCWNLTLLQQGIKQVWWNDCETALSRSALKLGRTSIYWCMQALLFFFSWKVKQSNLSRLHEERWLRNLGVQCSRCSSPATENVSGDHARCGVRATFPGTASPSCSEILGCYRTVKKKAVTDSTRSLLRNLL